MSERTIKAEDLDTTGVPDGSTITVVDGIAQWRSWADIHAGRAARQQREAVQA